MADSSSTKSRDKGKGKADDADNTTGETSVQSITTAVEDAPSVFSRIAQSAASLGRDIALTRPSGADLTSLASTAKTGSASRGTLMGAAAAHDGLEGSAATAPFRSPSSMRNGHTQQHVLAQDAAFAEFLDGVDVDMSLPTETSMGLDDGNNSSSLSGMEPVGPTYQTLSAERETSAFQGQPSTAVTEQEGRDGLAVVNLLAADGPLEEEPNFSDIELAEDEATALKRVLFSNQNGNSSSKSTTSQNWDNVLNLIPDFIRPNPQGGFEDEPVSETLDTGEVTKSHHTQAIMGLPHSPESSRLWLDQWHDVLTRYNDEVWGGLTPLVAEAREEVDRLQQLESNSAPAETKALNRLRQILGHLRG
ncbi:hypothetical protein SEPCBS119000_000022 [Sporothrix epigloea]|uniref:Uncharacterized protein n=1 Tax=Sporothrix epigloea TaxID=1892477 RepID=A0ABP0D6K6_9PEZI